ncbi:uncharacterized protein [Dysidea avara]|uniref:uncharacterized protein n=1 Tax=Dysidea avara TaxID=196820 RepID=UPI00332DE99E
MRRWLTGLVRTDMHESDLHNHPHYKEKKIPVKVDMDVRRAVIENPHLKTSDLLTGKGMDYIPGMACLATTNRSKIKNIRLNTLRDAKSNLDARSAILSFEAKAKKYDQSMIDKIESKNLDHYGKLAHPYIRKYGIGDDFTWVLVMSPLMSEVLSTSQFIEVDVTYKSCFELPYLLNVVALNYITMRWMVVSHVRMNHIDVNAYARCFRAIFEQAGEDHPSFKVGESLIGIIADWSDQKVNGLEMVIGKSTAESILKGCQLHFIRSVQRVAKKLSNQNKKH